MWEITEGQRKTKKDVSSSFIYPQSDNDGPDLRFVTCTVSRADEAWLGRQIPIYLTLPRVVAVVDGKARPMNELPEWITFDKSRASIFDQVHTEKKGGEQGH